jgi:hypothetical protein
VYSLSPTLIQPRSIFHPAIRARGTVYFSFYKHGVDKPVIVLWEPGTRRHTPLYASLSGNQPLFFNEGRCDYLSPPAADHHAG